MLAARTGALLALLVVSFSSSADIPVVVRADDSITGLEVTRGQRKVNLASTDLGRIIATYSRGLAVGCSLWGGCTEQSETWTFVADQNGLVSPPQRLWPELDARSGLNMGTIFSGRGEPAADGRSAYFQMLHAGHNSNGGNFVKLNDDGQVLSRNWASGSYTEGLCVMGNDVATHQLYVDPVRHFFHWWPDGVSNAGSYDLGGYGYNFTGGLDIECDENHGTLGPVASFVRKVNGSHLGITQLSVNGTSWSSVGTEARLQPMTPCPSTFGCDVFRQAIGDETGVALLRHVEGDGRYNVFFVRFRLTATGPQLVDQQLVPLDQSVGYEGLDGGISYAGNGLYYVGLYQGGNSASGQPANTAQRVSMHELDFESGSTTLIGEHLFPTGWSGQIPRGSYNDEVTLYSFNSAISCDGGFYLGGVIDQGNGRPTIYLFRQSIAAPSCSSVVLTPKAVSFGEQGVGTRSAMRSISVLNLSPAAIRVQGASVSGADAADFAASTNCPRSLEPASSCRMDVEFAPITPGNKQASAVLKYDRKLTAEAAMTGNGTGGGGGENTTYDVSPVSLNFGSVPVGTTTGSQRVTVSNTGNSSLLIGSISLTGKSSKEFAFLTDCPTSLSSAASCAIDVTFTPSRKGGSGKVAALSINSLNAPPIMVELSGTAL